MQLTCPACRKRNESVKDTNPACSRCGCDLSRLRAVQLAAAQARHTAALALRLGRWADALDHAERAWRLFHHPHAAQLAALASGALGDTGTVLLWRHRTRLEPDPESSH